MPRCFATASRTVALATTMMSWLCSGTVPASAAEADGRSVMDNRFLNKYDLLLLRKRGMDAKIKALRADLTHYLPPQIGCARHVGLYGNFLTLAKSGSDHVRDRDSRPSEGAWH